MYITPYIFQLSIVYNVSDRALHGPPLVLNIKKGAQKWTEIGKHW